jgi:hypothetical protein
VWLPPQYDYPSAARLAFPVVIAYASANDLDLFKGINEQVGRRLADPFVVVLPARCGAAPAQALLDRHYRLSAGRTARAVLGVDDQAPCAVREAYAHPDGYSAGVGVSGTYASNTVARPIRQPRPQILLATVSGQETERSSAFRLRDELRGAPAEVRVMDGVTPRRRLFAQVAGYFTEKLDGPVAVYPTNHP